MKNHLWDVEKEQFLSVVAFSANKSAVETLEEFFKEYGIECFFFYENFLSTPVTGDIKYEELESITSLVPFLRRYIELPQIKFVPDIDAIEKLNKFTRFQDLIENPPLTPKSEQSLKKIVNAILQGRLLRVSLTEEIIYGRGLFPLWRDITRGDRSVEEVKKEHEADYPSSKPFIWHKRIKNREDRSIVGFTGKFKKNFIKGEYLQSVLKSRNKIPLLIEYFVSDFQFLLSNVDEVDHLFMSISSKDIFYGYVWLFWVGRDVKHEEFEKELKNELGKIIEEKYLPVLTIFENAWEERILEDIIDSSNSINWQEKDEIKSENGRVGLLFMKKERFENELEDSFRQLWERRQELWNRQKNLKKLKDTLIFYKFFLSSEKMINCLEDIIRLKPSKSGKFLPSALVIGGPGAGKDSISKLIKIFSEDYFDVPMYTINVASLKPSSVAPLFTLGTEFSINRNDKEELKTSLIGIFQKILRDNEYKEKKCALVVLDELNTLDVDTQGALLRLLENSELIPIGGIEKIETGKDINFLIIGTMNEDPEKLTKENVFRKITQERVFGELVGEILYEHFRKIRRLREDLYYRLIRGGKVVLPSLNERREDIPILFYRFCNKEIKDQKVKLYIPLDVLEELTARHLDWIGNVRQLQSLSQIVMRYARQDQAEDDLIIINKRHLLLGLKKIGMIDYE